LPEVSARPLTSEIYPPQEGDRFDRKRNLTKCNFIFLTGSTGWPGYNHT
jgi:hypothetical protein